MFQPFRPCTNAHGIIGFVTKSWSDTIDPVTKELAEYEVEFDIASHNVHCSCCDSVMRRKNYLPIGDPRACKHSRLASELLYPIIARALGELQ